MGLMGSKAVVGQLSMTDFDRSRVDVDELIRRFSAVGISRESMLAATRDDVLAWVELHIEQGTRLEDAGIDIGVVNAIVGIRSIHVVFAARRRMPALSRWSCGATRYGARRPSPCARGIM